MKPYSELYPDAAAVYPYSLLPETVSATEIKTFF
jgi:hypothetical protein